MDLGDHLFDQLLSPKEISYVLDNDVSTINRVNSIKQIAFASQQSVIDAVKAKARVGNLPHMTWRSDPLRMKIDNLGDPVLFVLAVKSDEGNECVEFNVNLATGNIGISYVPCRIS